FREFGIRALHHHQRSSCNPEIVPRLYYSGLLFTHAPLSLSRVPFLSAFMSASTPPTTTSARSHSPPPRGPSFLQHRRHYQLPPVPSPSLAMSDSVGSFSRFLTATVLPI